MPDRLVGYYGSWSVYRHPNGKFTIDNIDALKFTHLIYAFIGLNADGTIKIMDNWNDIQNNGFKRFVNLRRINPNLRAMVAIGGWNESSCVYSCVAEDEHLREKFATNVVNFLKQYGFDGLDFDWEYPGQRGGKACDKRNFLELLKVLRRKFTESGNNYLLTAAVSASKSSMSTSYKVYEMSQYLDFVNLMSYDFHGCWDGCTGHNAPLRPASPSDELNVESSVTTWMNAGAPAHKLVLGLPTYGHSYYLNNPSIHKVGATVGGPGEQGRYTQQPGMLGYNEICELQNQSGWTVGWDEVQRVPYMYKGYQWISYDNVRSIKEKVQYARSLHLGGVMVWSIETDDFLGISGKCNPLISAIRDR